MNIRRKQEKPRIGIRTGLLRVWVCRTSNGAEGYADNPGDAYLAWKRAEKMVILYRGKPALAGPKVFYDTEVSLPRMVSP